MNASEPPGGWPTPRSLYVHVPFCRHRCSYCNFSVLANRDDLQDRFLDAIEIELSSQVIMRPIKLDTLYFGGGTPTQLTRERLIRLFAIVSRHVELADSAEVTCEANPEDMDVQTLSVLVDGGVNRLSLGVQSFNDKILKTLSRFHRGDQAMRTIELACDRIPNVSIDLIFAAPGETLEDWQQDLQIASSLPINHISTYSLTYEKGTEYWSRRRRGELIPVSEDTDIRMYHASRRVLTDAGFGHYEISSFARPGFRSRHNAVYWNGFGWYAVGPSAARFVGGSRDVNHRSSTTYLKRIIETGDATSERERISLKQHACEIAAFGIRQIDGIDLKEIDRRVGEDHAANIRSAIEPFIERKWLICRQERVCLSEQGLLFADAIESKILDSIER